MPGLHLGPVFEKFQSQEAGEIRKFLLKKLGQLNQMLGDKGKKYGVLRGKHHGGTRWWVRIIPSPTGGAPITQIFSERLSQITANDGGLEVRGFLARMFTGDLLSDAPDISDPEFAIHTQRTTVNTGSFTCGRSDYLKRKEDVTEDGGVIDWLSYNCQLMLTFKGYRDRYSIRDPYLGLLLNVFTNEIYCGGTIIEPGPPYSIIGLGVQQTTDSFYLHTASASSDLFFIQIWSVEIRVANNKITIVGDWTMNAEVGFYNQLRSVMLFDGAGAFACATLFSGELLEVRFNSSGQASFEFNADFIPEYPSNCTRTEAYVYPPLITEQLLSFEDVPCVRPTGYCEETSLTQTGTNTSTTNYHTISWSGMEEFKTPLSVDFDYKGRRVIGFISMTPAASISASGVWMTRTAHSSTNYTNCCLTEEELIDCIEEYLNPPNTGWCWWVTDELWFDAIYEGWKEEVVSFPMDPFDFKLTAERETEGARDNRVSETNYSRYGRIIAAWDAKENNDYSTESVFDEILFRDAEAGNVSFAVTSSYRTRYAEDFHNYDSACASCVTPPEDRHVSEVVFEGAGSTNISGKIREIDTFRTAILYYDLRYGYIVRLLGKKAPTFSFTYTPQPGSNSACGVYCESTVQYTYTQTLEIRCRDSNRSIEYTEAVGDTVPFISRMVAACIDASQINQSTEQEFFMHPLFDDAWIAAPGVYVQEDFYFTRATDAQGNLLLTVPKEEKITLLDIKGLVVPMLSFVSGFETLFFYHGSWLEKASIADPDVGLWGIRSY